MNFFLAIFVCSNWVIYQSIALDLLYKTAYMTFSPHFDLESRMTKYSDFPHIKFSLFSSIVTKCLDEESIAAILITSCCSPFNSVSIHILDIVSKCSEGKIARVECWTLTSVFTGSEIIFFQGGIAIISNRVLQDKVRNKCDTKLFILSSFNKYHQS